MIDLALFPICYGSLPWQQLMLRESNERRLIPSAFFARNASATIGDGRPSPVDHSWRPALCTAH